MLPSRYSIDYEAVLSDARGAHGSPNISLVLKERLPSVWRDRYMTTISHEANLVRFRHHSPYQSQLPHCRGMQVPAIAFTVLKRRKEYSRLF